MFLSIIMREKSKITRGFFFFFPLYFWPNHYIYNYYLNQFSLAQDFKNYDVNNILQIFLPVNSCDDDTKPYGEERTAQNLDRSATNYFLNVSPDEGKRSHSPKQNSGPLRVLFPA